MAKEKAKHFGIRVDQETHDKLFHIAAYEGRTGNGQILYLIQKCIREFEKEHGPIEFPDK